VKLLVDTCVFVDAFDPSSSGHAAAYELLVYLLERNVQVTMPAHGWFEARCSWQRLKLDGKFVGPLFQGEGRYPVELIPIDDDFIDKYTVSDIPFIKSGDHIWLAVAKVEGYPLVTSDVKMTKIARQIGVRVFAPTDLKKGGTALESRSQ